MNEDSRKWLLDALGSVSHDEFLNTLRVMVDEAQRGGLKEDEVVRAVDNLVGLRLETLSREQSMPRVVH